MVNITALEKLVRFINQKNLRPMRLWRSRRNEFNGQTSSKWWKLKKNVRMILNLISGNDIVSMLKSVLSKGELKQLKLESTQVGALQNLSNCYKNTGLKKRWYFARELKNSKMSLKSTRSFGFPVSKKLWINCNNGVERKKGGGKSIPQEYREAIRDYLQENSNIASNRLVVNKDETDEDFNKEIPARYLEKNQSELYHSFPLSHKISKTTFAKYLRKSGEFKKPIRMTDLCDYCEKGKSIRKSLIPRLTSFNYEWQDKMNLEHIKRFFMDQQNVLKLELNQSQDSNRRSNIQNRLNDVQKILQDVISYDTILFHQNIARIQRQEYNDCRTNVEKLKTKILFEIDFKQKISIGFGPRQLNTEYYDKRNRLRTCLSFGIYYVDSENKIKMINFDIIAHDNSQDAASVVRGFRILREQPFFTVLDNRENISEYVVWMDCGKHFRNNIVAGYLFDELAEEGIKVNCNYFCEKHGKNTRDAHFSLITKFVYRASLKKRLICSDDVVDAIKQGQSFANENKKYELDRSIKDGQHRFKRTRKIRNFDQTRTEAISLSFSRMNEYLSKYTNYRRITIPNIETFYNYRTIEVPNNNTLKLVTSILSNQTEFVDINDTKNIRDLEPNSDIEREDILEEEDLSTSIRTMKAKRDRINLIFNKLKERLRINNQPTDTPFLNFVSLNTNENEVPVIENRAEAEVTLRNLPPFCRGEMVGRKPPCDLCTAPCSLSKERLRKNDYTHKVVLDELKIHHHPTSREIPNLDRNNEDNRLFRPRTTREAAAELSDHYFFSHGVI